jgi:hypothetical protein
MHGSRSHAAGVKAMDSTTTSNKPQAASPAKTSQQPRRAQPARLPEATAELVNRLLAARCGAMN